MTHDHFVCRHTTMSVGTICLNILRNTRSLAALTTNVKGVHGIEGDVFLSLPVVLGESGITHIVKQNLTEKELLLLRKSAVTLEKMQNELKV